MFDTEYYTTMASLRVLAFDHEGRPIAFDTWHDDLQLYLLSDIKDSVSLFDHVSGVAPAPRATADGSARSQWLSRDATARLAIRKHLPVAECTHFGQHRTAQTLYDAIVARYSSPATATLGRLLLPYLFPELLAFATVVDLVTHLRTSKARYRATVPAKFLATNQPPMFITLYFIVSRLPDSLRSDKDHFPSLDPTSFTVDLLEQHLLAAETSAVAVGAPRGTLRLPFFEGCSPSPLSSSFASVAAADVSVTQDVSAASTSANRRSSKGKGGKGGGGGSGGGGGGSGVGAAGAMVGEAVEVVEVVGLVVGVGALVVAVEAAEGVAAVEAVGLVVVGLDLGVEALVVVSGSSSSSIGARPSRPSSSVSGWFSVGRIGVVRAARMSFARVLVRARHAEHRCFARLDDAWRAEFGDDVERPRCAELLRSGVAIFDLDYDAIISAMYALPFSAEGDCYRCVPPDPGIVAAALGASASGTPPCTSLTPLPAPVPVRLAYPSGDPDVARSSTVLPCPADAMVITTTPGGQRVSICTCTRTVRHLATFTCRPGSSLYTMATEPPQVTASAQVPTSGHPSLPRLRGMHSWFLVLGLPRSLPPLPPSPAPPCLPCVEGGQRAAPHSSSFPPTTDPLQTLHMDVWGPARVSGQGLERYFLLIVDNYTRYTTVFPLRSKGEVVDVLIPWIRTVRLQLRERFGTVLPVLRLHSDRGGEFSSDLLRNFCRGEGILQSFTLPDSPQQNGIAEHRVGLVMEVTRTSMIHAAAPHFLWLFAAWYAAHQLNLWPCVSLSETSPSLRWTGKVGDASVFWVWGSRAFVHDTSADKLSACAIPCVFLGFFPDAPGWQFYHPTSRRVLPSQDVTFDESVPFYRLFPYRSAPPPPPPLFLVAVGLRAAPGAASGGAASGGAEPGGAGSEGAGSRGAEPRGAEPEGVEPGGAESEGVESGSAVPSGAALSGGSRDTGARGAAVTPGAGGTGGAAATAGDPTEPGAAGAGGAGAGGAGVGGPGAGGARAAGVGVGGTGARGPGAAGAGAVDPSARGAGGTMRPQSYFVPLLQQTASPLLAPSPHNEQSGGLRECREPASCRVLPVRTARRAPRLRSPPVPGMYAMALRPSFVPLRVPLPAPPDSSLPEVPDPASDRASAARPTVARLFATGRQLWMPRWHPGSPQAPMSINFPRLGQT
ncbi:unnamed protein product [Closterium sp. NIES-54]